MTRALCLRLSSSIRVVPHIRGLSTIQLIKQLREEIQAPLNIVKTAVSSAQPQGDYDAALTLLKAEMTKRGEKLVAKSLHRKTPEGWVIASRSNDHKSASLSVLNCETDFVAKSDKVVDLAAAIGRDLSTPATCAEAAAGAHASLSQDTIDSISTGGIALKNKLTESMSLFGESMRVTRAVITRQSLSPNAVTGIHCHGGPTISKDIYLGRMGAMVNLSSEKRDVSGLADELAREIVAQNPESTDELWTLEKVGDVRNRTVRQWAGDDVRIEAWTRLERT